MEMDALTGFGSSLWDLLTSPTVAALLLAALAPLAGGLTADRAARASANARRVRAYERLTRDPLVFVGAELDKLLIDGNGGLDKVLGRSHISALRKGMVEITDDDGRRMNFTGEEFERMHPIFCPPVGSCSEPRHLTATRLGIDEFLPDSDSESRANAKVHIDEKAARKQQKQRPPLPKGPASRKKRQSKPKG